MLITTLRDVYIDGNRVAKDTTVEVSEKAARLLIGIKKAAEGEVKTVQGAGKAAKAAANKTAKKATKAAEASVSVEVD